MKKQSRQLAAILFTDIVGSTAMMQQDEQTAVSANKRYVTVLKKYVSLHCGEILNDYGDGSLCTFSSATEAVRAAIEIQQQLQIEPKVPLRIGLHIGEIFFEDDKVFGDGVNIASRIQSLGIANSILFSSEINSKIKNQQEFKSISVGRFHFKNVDEPIEVFALALDGLIVPKSEEMSGKLKEIEKQSAIRKWIMAAAAVLLIFAFYFIYQHFYNVTEFSGEKTIAVLPFENVGKENSEEYISDGITQDIINSLSRIASLKKVVGWFSVKGFKKTAKPMNVIANELGVAAILKGTLQTLGEKTRIIVELIEVRTQKRLWGDDYEYDSKDLIIIHSKIAGQIVDALKASVTPEEKKRLSKNYTENVEAYKFYLKGRSFWNRFDDIGSDSAEANYKRAIELEADYALAYAGLADCYSLDFKGNSQLERVPVAKLYVRKALSLDSTLSEALTTLGFIQENFDYAWAEARKNLKRAIELDPNNYQAHADYGLLLMYFTPDKDAAFRELKKAVELNPLSALTNFQLARNYYFTGKYDLALKQFKKVELFAGGFQHDFGRASIGLIYLRQKLYPQAKVIFDNLPEGDGRLANNNQIMQSYAYAVMGDKTRARALLEKTIKKYPNILQYRNSQVYVALGDFKKALDQLELGYENRNILMFWTKADPAFDPIRNEPRFKTLVKKMNLE